MPAPDKQYKAFADSLAKILEIAASKKGKLSDDVMASMLKAKDAASFLEIAFTNSGALPMLLVAYEMVKEYAKAGLAEKWAFARKFNEYFQSAGAAKCDVRYELSKIFALSRATDAALMVKDGKAASYKLVKALADDDTAPLLSGANSFNGTVWFNKEVVESSIRVAFATALLDSKEEEAILKVFKTVLKAKEDSGYKCDEFVKPFAPEEKKAKTEKTSKTAKASGEKKSAEKKTTKKSK